MPALRCKHTHARNSSALRLLNHLQAQWPARVGVHRNEGLCATLSEGVQQPVGTSAVHSGGSGHPQGAALKHARGGRGRDGAGQGRF